MLATNGCPVARSVDLVYLVRKRPLAAAVAEGIVDVVQPMLRR
jgi:hypothetical protein